MLTKDHLKFQVRNGAFKVSFIAADAPVFLELAGSLLEIYRGAAAEKLRRSEIEEETAVWLKGGRNPELAAALDKLICDHCVFAAALELDYAACRRKLLTAGGELLHRKMSANEYGEAMRKAAEDAGFAFGQDIYGDLPENEQLISCKELSPCELLHRYNMAQAQGLLFYASTVHVRLVAPEAGELRRLFKYLKFFRLLAEIKRDGDDMELDISGPYAIFANSRKYALQLAAFLPALALMPRWSMRAELECGNRRGTLTLDEKSCLRSHYRNFSGYIPEEITMFHRHFKEKCRTWEIVGDAPLLENSDDGRVFFPDLSFRKVRGKKRIDLELFHRWHRTELTRRLEYLTRHPGVRLLCGIDRGIVADDEFSVLQAQYPKLANRLFLFRDFPGVDRVRKMLDEFADGEKTAASR